MRAARVSAVSQPNRSRPTLALVGGLREPTANLIVSRIVRPVPADHKSPPTLQHLALFQVSYGRREQDIVRPSVVSMLDLVPQSSLAFGFVNDPVGSHTSRTIMVPELSHLLASVPPDAPYDELRGEALENNVLHKASITG